jgi:hypothetical protein
MIRIPFASCADACCSAETEDTEFIVKAEKPTMPELEKIQSPVPGHATTLKDNTAKTSEIQGFMTFLHEREATLDKEPIKDGSDNEDCEELSTLCDSTSEASEDCLSSGSDGELGPEDLVVVGHGLIQSGNSSSSGETSPLSSLESLGEEDAKEAVSTDGRSNRSPQTDQDTAPPQHASQHNCDGWWNDADVAGVKGFEDVSQLARLLDARVIKSQQRGNAPAPWEAGQSSDLYTAMGMVDKRKSYVAVWLKLGSASLLFVLEQTQPECVKTCSEDNKFLSHRLKFLSNPVRMRGALPCKPLKDAEAIGTFFGKRNSSCAHGVTDKGIDYLCVQVDVFAKWYVKVAFQQVALRLGNVLELILVDEPSIAVLAACRLTVTPEFLELLAA